MTPMISVIIPNYNGAATLDACLQAATTLQDEVVEIIVVDDGSKDNSVDIIRHYPCQLIQLATNHGASHARNIGTKHSRGEILFFTDADCLIDEDVLARVRRGLSVGDTKLVLGGTYTPLPYDARFCSRFQSVFIHYSETRHMTEPDYVATHALAIRAETFHTSGGFSETMGPILEDVEFSHRLRRSGVTLKMEPGFQVQHIFNYSLLDSWRNAIRKSRYWIQYSLNNRDLFTDSGTASLELKFNVSAFYLSLVLLLVPLAGHTSTLPAVVLLASINLFLSRGLLKAFYVTNGPVSGIGSILYYLAVYPIPIGIGSLAGLAGFMRSRYYNGSHA